MPFQPQTRPRVLAPGFIPWLVWRQWSSNKQKNIRSPRSRGNQLKNKKGEFYGEEQLVSGSCCSLVFGKCYTEQAFLISGWQKTLNGLFKASVSTRSWHIRRGPSATFAKPAGQVALRAKQQKNNSISEPIQFSRLSAVMTNRKQTLWGCAVGSTESLTLLIFLLALLF